MELLVTSGPASPLSSSFPRPLAPLAPLVTLTPSCASSHRFQWPCDGTSWPRVALRRGQLQDAALGGASPADGGDAI